jgi:hypothetical protein
MAKEVFDQARPKSTKAQLFADAFAGCDEWVVLSLEYLGIRLL